VQTRLACSWIELKLEGASANGHTMSDEQRRTAYRAPAGNAGTDAG
jgi:hypothetical protein